MEHLRQRISDVRYGPVENEQNTILFKFDNVQYYGALKGRNADLVLGAGAVQDAAIALRVLLDGDAPALTYYCSGA